jgi:TRAP-type C4-dicarboxylate transport system substrate-binding protein
MKKSIRSVVLVGLLLLVGIGDAGAKTSWNANSVWPPNNHQTIALEEFAAKVKEASGGELEIVVNSGGALGYKGPELLKVVRDGLVPISDILISGVAGDDKIFQLVTLPFLALNFEEAKLLNDLARPYFDKAAAKWGQKILYISPWPGAGLWSKRKVLSVAEMKGLKTRTYDKNGAYVVEATGGTPLSLPFSEVYSALATGVIDSVITSSPTAVDAKFWEVLKYYQPLNITIATNMVNVNLNNFNKLDKKTQDMLVKIGQDMEAAMWQKVKALDKEKEAVCNQNGIESVAVSKEMQAELAKITEKIRSEWLADAPADAKAIYQDYLKKIKR